MNFEPQRVRAVKAGGPKVLQFESFDVGKPGPGEVLVRNRACGIAFADVLVREGLYPGVNFEKGPITPGYEVVGTISTLGRGVEGFELGDYVAALTVTGGYATHAIVPAADLVRVPQSLAPEVAAALVLNGITAYQLLNRCCPADISSVAIFGAAGGVGSLLLDLARHRKLATYGFGARPKHEFIAEKGATPLSRVKDPVKALRAVAPDGVDLVIDGVGMSNVKRSVAMLREGGTVVVYGAQSVTSSGRKNTGRAAREWAKMPRWSALDIFQANRGIVGYLVTGRKAAKPDQYRADLAAVFDLAVAGVLVPTIDSFVDLRDAASAHEHFDASTHIGKIVLNTK